MGLGIETSTAERYAQALAHPDVGYTKVSELDTIHENRLISAGVNVGRHRDIIIRAVQGTAPFLSASLFIDKLLILFHKV